MESAQQGNENMLEFFSNPPLIPVVNWYSYLKAEWQKPPHPQSGKTKETNPC